MSYVRHNKTHFLSDSGALLHQKGGKNVKPQSYVTHHGCTDPWPNLVASCVGPDDWTTWAQALREYTAEYGHIMESCADNEKRFPSHVILVVMDNLNGVKADHGSEEARWSDERKTSMNKSLSDVVSEFAIDGMLDHIGSFKSAIYCQTAPA